MDRSLVDAVWDALPSFVNTDRRVSECMHSVATLCNDHVPHEIWARFRRIDYDTDVAALQTWIPGAIESRPPKIPVAGLFMPLVHLSDDESPHRSPTYSPCYSDIRFAGTSVYVAGDAELNWVNYQTYEPRPPYSRSRALFQISRVAQAINPGGLDSPATESDRQTWKAAVDLAMVVDWAMPLAFAVSAIRELLTPHTNRVINPDNATIGVAVGWEDGDFLEIGQLTESGFLPNTPVS